MQSWKRAGPSRSDSSDTVSGVGGRFGKREEGVLLSTERFERELEFILRPWGSSEDS